MVPKHFQLVAHLTYWTIGYGSPLQQQSYTDYQVFMRALWLLWLVSPSPQRATTHHLGTTGPVFSTMNPALVLEHSSLS